MTKRPRSAPAGGRGVGGAHCYRTSLAGESASHFGLELWDEGF